MKRILALCMLVCLVGCKGNLPLTKTQYGFNIDAKEANLVPIKPALMRYKLILKAPSQRVLVYEGYPKTHIHQMGLKNLIENWVSMGFKKKSPQAILIVEVPHKEGKMEKLSVPMKLANPMFNVNKNELAFDVTTLIEPNHWMVGKPVKLAHLMIEVSLRKAPQLAN